MRIPNCGLLPDDIEAAIAMAVPLLPNGSCNTEY
jgi:hypothetical protein